jgi:hypothetical protein
MKIGLPDRSERSKGKMEKLGKKIIPAKRALCLTFHRWTSA